MNKKDSFESRYQAPVHKRPPQIYSTYIQQNADQTRSNDHKPHNKYASNNDLIKKPKLTQPDVKFSHENNPKTTNNVKKSEPDEEESTCIGLETFNYANVFLIKSNYILVCFNDSSKMNSLSFKGICSLLPLHGNLSINGYNLKKNLSQLQEKWFDLYSPETNSFVTILNKAEQESFKEYATLTNEQLNEVLIKQILNYAQICPNETLIANLESYLTHFQLKKASVFLLKSLNSPMCNYINYIENFQQVYQLPTANCQATNEIDSEFIRMGIYPVTAQNFNKIHRESIEEKLVCDEILQTKCESDPNQDKGI